MFKMLVDKNEFQIKVEKATDLDPSKVTDEVTLVNEYLVCTTIKPLIKECDRIKKEWEKELMSQIKATQKALNKVKAIKVKGEKTPKSPKAPKSNGEGNARVTNAQVVAMTLEMKTKDVRVTKRLDFKATYAIFEIKGNLYTSVVKGNNPSKIISGKKVELNWKKIDSTFGDLVGWDVYKSKIGKAEPEEKKVEEPTPTPEPIVTPEPQPEPTPKDESVPETQTA